MITYNQEKYIAQAIESILMQKTNFDIELVIGDDCSSDNTKQIIQSYYEKYPDKIIPIYRKVNSRKIGKKNFILALEECRGEYIAVLEGDDYWFDENKLQKQVNFLDSHPEYSLCCHNFFVIKEQENFEIHHKWHEGFFVDKKYEKYREVELNNLFNPYILKMMTILFRRDSVNPDKIKKCRYSKDILWFAALLENGKGACLNDYMGVYRMSSSGIWSMKNAYEQAKSNAFTLFEISKYFNHKKRYFVDLANDDLKHLYSMIMNSDKKQKKVILELTLKRLELIFYCKI